MKGLPPLADVCCIDCLFSLAPFKVMYIKTANSTNSTPASMREMFPSKHMSNKATEATMAKGISFFTVAGSIIMGVTKAAQPTINKVLKMLEPTTLPTAMSGVSFKADMKLTKNSGIDVPIATIVSPITICDICIRSAIATAPSVSLSAPHNTKAMPAIIQIIFNNIFSNYKLGNSSTCQLVYSSTHLLMYSSPRSTPL